MSELLSPQNPELKKALCSLFRDFFVRAERKRRWSLEDDIPWESINRSPDPVIATALESFCAVELFLPDYVAKALPLIRTNKAWAWFHVNWGYEESKHSLVLNEWLVRSGARSDEQMTDLEDQLFRHEWNLPMDSAAGMLMYAMVQELATWVHYRNLQRHIRKEDDPALYQLLQFVSVDERAHHTYYKRVTQLFLQMDRPATLELLRRIFASFCMPAVELLADSKQRMADIRALKIFNEDMFYTEIVRPLLEDLGVSRAELRQRGIVKKSDPVPMA